MKKFLIILLLGLLLSSPAFADERFEKDLKKISKLNSFFNNKGEPYQIQKNITKDKTIIIIYTHGSHGKNQKINSCKQAWNKIPPSIYQLDGTKIKDFTIKTYQLCSGVRGWTKKELGKRIPSISYNLKKGGSVLIDRYGEKDVLDQIKKFGENIELNKWSAVIFPEGTRSKDGKMKDFHHGGLMTLIKSIPSAYIVPLSINNSWKFGRNKYLS